MKGMIRNGSGIRAARQVVGFSLIEIAIVLLILAILATTLGSTMSGVVEARRRDETVQNMQKVEDAVVSFVSTTKRMPCPADGTLPSTDPNWGLESGRNPATGCPAALLTGVVPWRSLGITQADVVDGWQGMFTYRIQLALGADNAMTMTDCDPAGGAGAAGAACVTTCVGTALPSCTKPSAFLSTRGLMVKNVAGTVLADPASLIAPTGAAFVLISAGPNLGNAYNVNGVLVVGNPVAGTEEAHNQNNQAVQGYYVDDQLNAQLTNAHFDDIVRRPTVSTIINKANLGPRAH